MKTGSRERVLGQVRRALDGRAGLPHPGRLETEGPTDVLSGFRDRFTKSGGEVEQCDNTVHPGTWLESFLWTLESGNLTVSIGSNVPLAWAPNLATVAASEAAVGVSLAWGAAADTGSVILESTGTRAVQLLPPIHVIWVPVRRIFPRLQDAIEATAATLPAALGVHSGPSKSADIGGTVVTGVHGPGRIIAVVVAADRPDL